MTIHRRQLSEKIISDSILFTAAIPLSVDHKPDRSDERERIEQAGGFIIWAGKKLSWSYIMNL